MFVYITLEDDTNWRKYLAKLSAYVVWNIHNLVHKWSSIFFFPMTRQPLRGPRPPDEASRSHTFRHTTLGRTPLDERPDNTQHSQERDIHALGGIFFCFFACLGFFPFDPFLYCLILSSFLPLCGPYYRPYNKHNTNIHAPGGIRTHNPSKQAAVDPRLRPRCHWNRQLAA
jgi:hypothetical protein